MKTLITLLLRVRWAYFHIHPSYIKFYVDEARTEAHFFHTKTNSIHSDYKSRG